MADLRGFGESGLRPKGPFAHHSDLAAVLDELEAGRSQLVGCSLGAGIVAEVALARPELVASLLLVSPAGALLAKPSDELRRFSSKRRARRWSEATSTPQSK